MGAMLGKARVPVPNPRTQCPIFPLAPFMPGLDTFLGPGPGLALQSPLGSVIASMWDISLISLSDLAPLPYSSLTLWLQVAPPPCSGHWGWCLLCPHITRQGTLSLGQPQRHEEKGEDRFNPCLPPVLVGETTQSHRTQCPLPVCPHLFTPSEPPP